MKITKSKLKQIIKEELEYVLLEQSSELFQATGEKVAQATGEKVTNIAVKKAWKKAIKELQAAEIPQKKNAFTNWFMKYGVKLPVVGKVFKFIFFGREAKNILIKADAAYVKDGWAGAAAVVGRSGIGFVPIAGDIANVVELLAQGAEGASKELAKDYGAKQSAQTIGSSVSGAKARGYI